MLDSLYVLRKSSISRNRFLYEVVNVESGSVVANRTSSRHYVACTVNGEHFFSRRDLVGRGVHGRLLHDMKYQASYNRSVYMKERKALSVALLRSEQLECYHKSEADRMEYREDCRRILNERYPLDEDAISRIVSEKQMYGRAGLLGLEVVYLN